jgi:hypothetical protein
MDAVRKIALAGGVLYLITFITSIPALVLKDAARNNVEFMLGSGSATAVTWGAVLDVVLALAGIGCAVALYPVTKRQSEIAGIGYVTSRLLEAAMIFVGCLTLFTMVTLRQNMAGATGAEAASLVTTGKALIAVHNWTFLLGPGLMAGVNALFLGSVMYRSRLVPRLIPLMGLIGAPLLIASSFATMFGLWDQTSTVAGVLTLPVALWELSLGLWLTFKGFKPARIIEEIEAGHTRPGVAVPAAV